MHIDYQISENDFVVAANLAMRKRSWLALFTLYLLPCIGAILVATATVTLIAGTTLSSVLSLLLLGLFWICLPTVFYPFQFRRSYRKTPLLRERRSLDLDQDSLRFSSETSDSRTSWRTYTKFAENARTFILFQQGNQVFIPISKRELTESQITELRSLLEAHLPRK